MLHFHKIIAVFDGKCTDSNQLRELGEIANADNLDKRMP